MERHPTGMSVSSETLLRLLFEQAPDPMAVLEGPQHVFTQVNAAFRRVITSLDVRGRPASEALPELCRQGLLELLGSAFASSPPPLVRQRRLRLQPAGVPEAAAHHADVACQPVFDPDGKPLGVFMQAIDVTAHVQTAQPASDAQHEQALWGVAETALSAMADFACLLDAELRFIYLNKPFLELLDLTSAQAIGRAIDDCGFEPELVARLARRIRSVLATGQATRGGFGLHKPAGEQRFEYIFSPVFGPGGAVLHVAGSMREVTERRAQERQTALLADAERVARTEAERASRAKDEFLATLSHELRTPLNAIMGWAELLRSAPLSDERVREAAQRIGRNARTQAQLISDLLDVSGIMSGKVRLTIERVPLARPVQAAIDAVMLDATRKQVLLEPPLIDPDLEVDCDPGRLQQVFWNLLVNAVKFTPDGGCIRVAVSEDPSDVHVRISDTGIGIDPAFVRHLFERFRQADSASNRTHGGLGLGLSISKKLMALHQGRIRADSAGPGQGSTFTVSLPRQQQPGSETARSSWGEPEDELPLASDPALLLAERKILVVDDDEESCVMLERLLSQYGAIVTTVSDPKAALRDLRKIDPALIVCDIGMPALSGYEFLRRVHLSSAVPAIAFTAFAREQDRQLALDAGFAAHLAKPAPPSALIALCSDVLAGVR